MPPARAKVNYLNQYTTIHIHIILNSSRRYNVGNLLCLCEIDVTPMVHTEYNITIDNEQ